MVRNAMEGKRDAVVQKYHAQMDALIEAVLLQVSTMHQCPQLLIKLNVYDRRTGGRDPSLTVPACCPSEAASSAAQPPPRRLASETHGVLAHETPRTDWDACCSAQSVPLPCVEQLRLC